MSAWVEWIVGGGLMFAGDSLLALLLARHFGWRLPPWFPGRTAVKPEPKRLERVVALFPARMRDAV